MDRKLLGFDIRELWCGPHDLWDDERRAAFLLREDVVKPLSVDESVWPSLFSTSHLYGSASDRLQLTEVPTPGWIGSCPPFWESLPDLRHHVERSEVASRPRATIAADFYVGKGTPPLNSNERHIRETTPAAPDESWRFLGFDVSDLKWSGLTNCGYPPPDQTGELEAARVKWGPALNRHHLFDDLDAALEYRAITDLRVPEHAPFFVCGMYLIDQIAKARPVDSTVASN